VEVTVKRWRGFFRDEGGLEMVEWAIVVGLVTVGLMFTLAAISLWMQGRYALLEGSLENR